MNSNETLTNTKPFKFNKNEIKRLHAIKERIYIGQDIFDGVISAWEGDYQNFKYDSKNKQYFQYLNIESTDTIIDAGINKGREILKFYKTVGKHGKIYAFDPWGSKHVCKPLKQLLLLNKKYNVDNLQIIQEALWNLDESVYFEGSRNSDSGSAQCFEKTKFNLDNQSGIKLDTYVYYNNIKKIDIIKMDIEGSELRALHGAIKTIKEFKPQIAIAVYHLKEHLYQIPELILSYNEDYKLTFNQYDPPFAGDRPIENIMYFH